MTSQQVPHVCHFVDGEVVAGVDSTQFDNVNPATGQVASTVSAAGVEDVRRAVASARRAFDEGPWPRLAIAERRRLLNRLADRVDEEAERLAPADTRDMGKSLRDSRDHDLPRVARNLRFFADYPSFAEGEHYPQDGFHTWARYEPKGVVAAISPWNFPLMTASWKVAPALGFGNTVVLKPAEESPTSALQFAELAAEVLPPGVLNVVQGEGPDAAGEHLVRADGVDLVTFTGSTVAGSAVMAAAAPGLKGVSLELGGKSPNVIFADADLDVAVPTALRAVFDNQGEVCLAGSRLFVEAPVFDEVVSALASAAQGLRLGDPFDDATQVGPLVSREHRERVESYLAIAREDGATVVVGGGRPSDPALAAGAYLEPTILTDVPVDSRCATEEIFGPVLVAQPFDDEAKVVEWANATPYGLAGMVWTRDLDRAHRLTAAIRSGMLWVNCFLSRDLRSPFGGAKRSGLGREGGKWSRDFFSEVKMISIATPGL